MKGRRRLLVLVCVGALCVLAVALGADVALARPSDLGENIGGELESVGKGVLMPLAGLMLALAVFKRDMGDGARIALVAIAAGMFLYAGEDVVGVVRDLGRSVGG